MKTQNQSKLPLPLRLVQRDRDGSLYLEGGSPESRHVAFDIACDYYEAEEILEAVNSHASLVADRDALMALYEEAEELIAYAEPALGENNCLSRFKANFIKARAALASSAK